MVTGKAEIAERRAIGPQLVGHYRPRRKALPFQEFSQQFQRSGFVTAALNQHVQHFALTIDGAPKIHLAATNTDNHFIEVPPVIGLRPT
jgi:hypothetical protein